MSYQAPRLMADLPVPGADAPTVASTFTGCGGACLGYRWAGFRTVVAAEFVPAAVDTYQANFPGVPVLTDDIRDMTGAELLAPTGLDVGELDLLEGSPPCAAFSASGKGSEGWGEVRSYSDRAQRVDDLFFSFARLVGEVQPKVFVGENVAGLLRGKARGYFRLIHRELIDQGYRVEARLLDAQWLGVPQRRKRVFFQGVRSDLGDLTPAWPSPHECRVSVAEALVGVAPLLSPRAGGTERVPRFGPADPETGEVLTLDGFAIAADAKNVKEGGQSGQFMNLIRADGALPAPTIVATGGHVGTASIYHQDGDRKFSLGELRRLCGFPDDFILTGSHRKRYERLGRAVPPPMTEAIGSAIRAGVLDQVAS